MTFIDIPLGVDVIVTMDTGTKVPGIISKVSGKEHCYYFHQDVKSGYGPHKFGKKCTWSFTQIGSIFTAGVVSIVEVNLINTIYDIY